MTGHEIAENLRTTKLRFTTGVLHKVVDGEDYFCVMGMKAFEAGVPISRLDKTWNCCQIPNASKTYEINDDAANFVVAQRRAEFSIATEEEKKQNVIKVFDSPQWHDFNFPVERFIQYLKDTVE